MSCVYLSLLRLWLCYIADIEILKMPKNNGNISKKIQKNASNKIKKKTQDNLQNVTSKRLTIPPNFLELGVTSSATKKDSTTRDCKSKNIYGFFNNCVTADSPSLRRSFRISQQGLLQNKSTTTSQEQKKETPFFFNKYLFSKATNKRKDLLKNESKSIFREINKRYAEVKNVHHNSVLDIEPFNVVEDNSDKGILFNYNLLHNKSSANSHEQKPESSYCFNKPLFSKTCNKYNDLLKNESKSIFRKINKKYAVVNNDNRNTMLEVGPFSISGENSKAVPINYNFIEKLSRQIKIPYLERTLMNCKRRKMKHLQMIEDLLYNRKSCIDEQKEDLSPKNNSSEEFQMDIDFDYVPPEEWVYKTPPRRIGAPTLEECNIQPAVICTDKKCKTIYEINSNASADFNQYTKDRNLPHVDKYKKNIDLFEQNQCVNDEMDIFEPYDPNNAHFFTQFRLNQLQQTKENNPPMFFNVEDYHLGSKINK